MCANDGRAFQADRVPGRESLDPEASECLVLAQGIFRLAESLVQGLSPVLSVAGYYGLFTELRI